MRRDRPRADALLEIPCRDPTGRPPGPAAAGVAVVGALALAGCSCQGPGDPYPAATNPPNTGAACDDDVGDLSRVATERGGTLKEPAGIDLIHAEARVTETGLRVSFTTVGPIARRPDPEFRLGQGRPASWRASSCWPRPPSAGPGWALRLVTFRPDGRGGIGEAPRIVLQVP